MKDKILDELETHLAYKISVTAIFILLFIGSVQFTSYQTSANADTLENNVQLMSDFQSAISFRHYYNETNQTENYRKTVNISENLIAEAQSTEYGNLRKANILVVAAMKTVGPYYPAPCSLPVDAGKCYVYLNEETLTEFNQTLRNMGTNESLRNFAERYNLTAPEEFYRNYSISRFNNGQNTGSIESGLSENRLNAKTYAVNIVYFGLLGLILSMVASRAYREITG